MKKKFIIFYSDDNLINQIGIVQKMSSNGKRMMIEFVDYFEMLTACTMDYYRIDTRYDNRTIENCEWIDVDEVFERTISFVELRDFRSLVDAFVKSEALRATGEGKGYGELNYDRRKT